MFTAPALAAAPTSSPGTPTARSGSPSPLASKSVVRTTSMVSGIVMDPNRLVARISIRYLPSFRGVPVIVASGRNFRPKGIGLTVL